MSLDGCKVLNEIMHDKEQPGSVRVAAVREVYDRAFGRPETQHKISGTVNFAQLLAEFTERRAIEQGQAAEVVEGDDQDALPPPNGDGAAEDQ